MLVIRMVSLLILFAMALTVPAARVFAQQDVPAPTILALEVTYFHHQRFIRECRRSRCRTK
jgi:hypothetical protein